jgi:hypothetical protein
MMENLELIPLTPTNDTFIAALMLKLIVAITVG